MTKKLISEELDQLIKEYLTDGILTDKERQVILKKAVGMGLDHDEIDLYLDAQVQKIDQATDAAVRKRRSKECPYCGAPVPQLADKCPECGQFITPEASKDLQDILENLENALVDLKSGKDIERNKAMVEKYARKAKLYYSNHPKIKPLLAEVNSELNSAIFMAHLKAHTKSIASAVTSLKFWSTIALFAGIFCIVMCNLGESFGLSRHDTNNYMGPATLFTAGSIVGYIISFLRQDTWL